MKKHIKAAWLARLTPEWWETRARRMMRNRDGCMCVVGVLCDTIDPNRWEGVVEQNFRPYRFPNGHINAYGIPDEVADAIGAPRLGLFGGPMEANDYGHYTYADLLAAVRAIPEEP